MVSYEADPETCGDTVTTLIDHQINKPSEQIRRPGLQLGGNCQKHLHLVGNPTY